MRVGLILGVGIFSLLVGSFSSLSTLNHVVGPAQAAESELPQILYFSGTIEIIYPDGTRIVLKTGEKPPVLESGVILRVLDGTVTVSVEEGIQSYRTGELIRITESQGVWQAFVSPLKTFQGTQTTNLSNPGEGVQSESEIRVAASPS